MQQELSAQHTADHTFCPGCISAQAKGSNFRPEISFRLAAQLWLASRDTKNARSKYLMPRTIKSYRLELAALTLYFGQMRLCDIRNEDIEKFQRARSEGVAPFRFQRSPAHVNDETRKLRKILMRANLWYLLQDRYQELIEPFGQPRRVMTKQEEAHFFRVAASKPEFAFVFAYCLLSVNTSASGAELRGLRLIDVDLPGRTLQVNAEAAKNPARVRTIPMVDDALWAATSLMLRAESIGCKDPYHYLLPYKRGNQPHDPTRQMSDNGMQKQWAELRSAAGLPWITPHLLRYQCITKMAEGDVDKVTAKRIAGHITDKMWDKYSRVRIESTREKMTEAFKKSSVSISNNFSEKRA